MHLDVRQIVRFYYGTELGRIVQRSLSDQVSGVWPNTKGQTVAGFGFASPLLNPFLAASRRVLCLMPDQQGVVAWPRLRLDGENRSVLVEETSWPVATGLVDRLVVLHGLETCESPAALLEEVWRTLGPGGRAIFIVPNRSGLWARLDATPFGFGRPYSLMQLETLLQNHRFSLERRISALYMPPSHRQFWIRTARYWEGFSHQFPVPFAAGVLIVEATKRQHAPVGRGLGDAVRAPLEVLDGMRKPAAGPVSGRTGLKSDCRLPNRPDASGTMRLAREHGARK